MIAAPSAANGWLVEHAERLCDSHERLLGEPLAGVTGSGTTRAERLFEADAAVLSSGLEDDPLFNYANRTALTLFELDWPRLVALPARESAEADLQAKRARLMQDVAARGFIRDYSGVRISATGRRFVIENATVWNVTDTDGTACGQAATFASWRFL